MTPDPRRQVPPLQVGAILRGLCPACRKGEIYRGAFVIHRRCPVCDHDFYPENGYYLGAMAVAFLVAAMTTVPPLVALKLLDVDRTLLILYPFAQLAIVGPLLLFYSRIFWLHLEYRLTHKLDG